MKKRTTRMLAALLAALMLTGSVACTKEEPDPLADSATATDTETDAPTAPATDPATDPATEPVTDPETAPETVPETEEETEAETEEVYEIVIPTDEPVDLTAEIRTVEENYAPTPGHIAFTVDKAYGFRDLYQYRLSAPAAGKDGSVFIDAEIAATLFGFDFSTNGTSATLSRKGVDLVFTTGQSGATLNDSAIPFPTVIRKNGVVRLSVDWLAHMMGYAVTYEDGMLLIAPTYEEITEEVVVQMNDRYKLYEEVVYNHDDVEVDKTGVGKYNGYDPSERMVGIAYTTWHRTNYPWGGPSSTWDLPLLGPYTSDNEAVIRQHGLWLASAGVDFVFVDWSNNTCYDPATMRDQRPDFRMIEEATDKLFEIWSTIPNAPKICIFVGPGHSGQEHVDNGNHQRKVDQVYRDYVEKYPDMYFMYDGKPLLMCYGATPTQYGAKPAWTDDRFTVRWVTGFVGQQGNLFNTKTLASQTYWSWEERGTQTFCLYNRKYVEAVTITAATRAQSEEGEPGYIPAAGRENGATLKRQFQRACDLGAKFAIIVSWNEWTTGEQLSVEVSKDLEPSQIHGTFYLDLLTEQIKKFKGQLEQ